MWQNFYPTMMNWGQQGYSMMGWGGGCTGGSGFLGLKSLGLLLLVIWSLAWKGMALWKASREGSRPWFVALLLINTAGILEILYLYVFSKKDSPVGEHHHKA